jgi:TolB protein
MTISAPPRSPGPQQRRDREELEALVKALIEEARRRARRRRLMLASVAAVVALVGLTAFALVNRAARSQSSSPAASAKPGATVSPTRSRIAFYGTRRGALRVPLYVADADGGGKRVLVREAFIDRPEYASVPAWSPDGRMIAFLSVRSHNQDIYVLDLDTNATQRVTRHPADDREPAWSPDGRRIAYVTWSGEAGLRIQIMNADGSDKHVLARKAEKPSWSPDGSKIVFLSFRDYTGVGPQVGFLPATEGDADIDVVNADGTDLRVLKQGRVGQEVLAWVQGPVWSPDGGKIAFYREGGGKGGGEVYVMNADGSHQHNVSRNRGTNDGLVAWSPR